VSLVLDSSAALAWIYNDEATDAIRRVFDAVAEQGAFVPALWRLEIANSLTVAIRAGGSIMNSAVRLWPILGTST
jgi:predicted nucleic acid-binding protein